jgi:transcriptional regulator with XRE-family HTH domain
VGDAVPLHLIRTRRQQLGLSQLELALRAGHGTKQEHVSRLESGRVTLPRWERVRALADALGVTPGTLLLQAGVITTGDLQGAAPTLVTSTPDRDVHPRAFICPPVGAIREWETATIFTCA